VYLTFTCWPTFKGVIAWSARRFIGLPSLQITAVLASTVNVRLAPSAVATFRLGGTVARSSAVRAPVTDLIVAKDETAVLVGLAAVEGAAPDADGIVFDWPACSAANTADPAPTIIAIDTIP